MQLSQQSLERAESSVSINSNTKTPQKLKRQASKSEDRVRFPGLCSVRGNALNTLSTPRVQAALNTKARIEVLMSHLARKSNLTGANFSENGLAAHFLALDGV